MIWIIAVLFFIVLGLLVSVISKLFNSVNLQLNSFRSELNQRLKETTQSLLTTHDTVGKRLDSATNIMGSVQMSLGRLEMMQQSLSEKMKDISSLQDLLKPPKVRGGMGEVLLENILTQIFGDHKEFYQFQYQFKSGQKVDAIINIGGSFVCIDAKFPLESFQRMIQATDDEAKKASLRDFNISVKRKTDDIAAKYILPDEGTMDFALMYIPSEGIYYEIIKEETIWSYAIKKKVIPVSPNTFYPYLMVIWRGLKGLLVQKNAQEVLAGLRRLQGDLDKFKEDFRLLGVHIKNSRDKYEDAQTRLNRFSDKLDNTHNIKSIESDEKGLKEA